MPSGITATADTSISDKIVLTFSGPASASIYRSLLLGITFTNDAVEPNTEPRLIDISLSDGTIHGNVATTTLAVTAVNDAPVLSDPAAVPTLYVTADDGSHGAELWATDGTAAGTKLVKDINPGIGNSYPTEFLELGNGKFVFSAVDGTHGTELWISDGSEAGTTLLKDLNSASAGGSSPSQFTALGGGKFVFRANDGKDGTELWISDGTPAGTTLLKDIQSGSVGSDPYWFTALGDGKFVFSADDGTHSYELWVSDGTPAGTTLLKDINSGAGSSRPAGFTSLGDGRVIFQADDGTHGKELWISDGTAAGTTLVKDIRSGTDHSSPYGFTSLGGGKFVFQAADGTNGQELWISDGTEAGTTLLKDINPGTGGSSPTGFTSLGNGRFVFEANDGTQGAELWISDGTAAGTTLLKDINTGADSSSPSGITSLGGGKFVFTATDSTNGTELWISDGTAAGTTLLKDINPGASGSSPSGIMSLGGGKFVFSADDGTHGTELWISDGTAAGTMLLSNINPSGTSASPVTLGVGASAPVSQTPAFTEDGGPVRVAPAVTLTDDSAALASLVVTLTNAPDGAAETLSVAGNLPAGITASYDATTHALTLSGSATPADYQAALRLVAYNNSAQAPHTADRALTIVATDDAGTASSPLSRTVTLTAVNDAPTGSLTVAGTPTQGETLTASNTLADPDGLATAVSYQWQRQDADGIWQAIAGATGSSYVLTQADVGAPVRAVGSYSDAGGKVESVVSAATAATVNVNDAPVAGNFEYTAQEDAVLILDVAGQGTDADGDALQISAVNGKVLTADGVQLAGGVVTLNAQGALLFTPTANFNGPVNFTYTLSDGHGGLSDGQIDITVQPVNDLPVAGNDTFSINEDTVATFNVLGNDSDVDGGQLTIRAINGVAVTFPDDKAEEKKSEKLKAAVSESSSNTAIAVEHGTVQVNSDGSLKFTPDSNFSGTTSFTYTVSNEHGGTQTATVTVNVLPLNDAPVASNFKYIAQEDAVLILDVAGQGTDADGDALQISAVNGKVLTADGVQVAGGVVTLNAQGALLFTPTANFNGPVNFTYTLSDGHGGLSDGQIDITVQPVNDAPVIRADKFTVTERETVVLNLLANDSDPENDTLRITSINGIQVPAAGTATDLHISVASGTITLGNDGKFTFTAAANYGGNVSFAYTVSDGHGGVSTGTVTGTVISVNEAPVAGDDTFSVSEDATSTFTVLGNDKDADGDVLRVVAIDNQPITRVVGSDGMVTALPVTVANGSVALNASGALVFTPKPNFNGATSFTYTVSDGQGGTDTGTVNLNVMPMNDAPTAANDSFTAAADVGTTLNLLANDSDIDGDTLRIVAINGVQINADQGNAAVKSKSAAALASTSTVTLADGTASAAVVSTPTTTTPASSTQATAIKIADGTLVLNADGTVLFTPNTHFSGKTSFTYSVSDGHGATATATAVIDVAPPIPAPVATDDTFTVAEDGAVVLNLLSNDTGDGPLSLVEINGIAWKEGAQAALAGGVVSRSADGTLQFRGAANFSGDVAFTYGISDAHGTRTTGRVSGTVTPVNDAPAVRDVSFAVAAGAKSQRIDVGAGTKDIDGDLIRVLAVDGKAITASTPVALASGTVSLAADGNLIFSPLATFSGATSFSYTLTDDHGGTQSAQLTGEVKAVESWASFGTELDKVLGDHGLSKPNNLNDLLAKATYLAPAAFSAAGAGTGVIPTGGYHAAAGYDLDLNAATPDAGALSKALAALINGQTYFNTPSVAKMDAQGAVASSVDQSLLFQSYLKNSTEVQVNDGNGIQTFGAKASAEHAWSKAFAQAVLSAGFVDDQVTKYDHQSQAKLHQSVVEKDAALTVNLDGSATTASKAAMDSKAAEFVSTDGGSAVEIARPVAVAETEGAANDQNAVVRMRQVGANDSSVMFYKVDDFAGTVDGLRPGDAGYEAATNAHAYKTDTGSAWVSGGGYGKYSETTITHINANDLIAMKLTSAGSTFYAFSDANEIVGGEHVAHLWSYGLNTWGWEDLYGGGDNDFNDIVVQLDFLKVKTSQDQVL